MMRTAVKLILLFSTLIALCYVASLTAASTAVLKAVIKSPLKIGNEYTMVAPVSAPTVTTSATLGLSCSNIKSYVAYTAPVNEAGVGTLSPASIALTPTSNQKKLTVTRISTAASNEMGWLVFMTVNGGATYYLESSATAAPSTIASAINSSGTTSATFFCAETSLTLDGARGLGCTGSGAPLSCCTGSGTGTCVAGQRDHSSINKVAQGIIAAATFGGGTQNPITENARQLDIGGPIVRFSPDGGITFANVVAFPNVVTICASGCKYTTLSAACAAETSTAAVPIAYVFGPGIFTTAATCSGEANASFIGAGQGTTILDTGASSVAIDLAGSDDSLVTGFTIKAMRPVSFGSGSGGINIVRNNDLIQRDDASIFGDCVKDVGGMDAGSFLSVENNRCGMTADGITIDEEANLTLLSKGNYFYLTAGALTTGSTAAMYLRAIPCFFSSIGDTFNLSGAFTANPNASSMFLFDGSATSSCASTAFGSIKDLTIKVNNTSADSKNSSDIGIDVLANATELGSLLVSGTTIDIAIPTDTTTGTAVGLRVANATTVVPIYASRFRTTGGQVGTRFDLKGNVAGSILVGPDSDWISDNDLLIEPTYQFCYDQRGIVSTDDNFVFFMADRAITIESVGCRCVGTCSTPPTFTLEDNSGNAMTITGTNPTCATTTGNATYAAVTAANSLVAGEAVAFDVTNTPVATTDWVILCITYSVDRQ